MGRNLYRALGLWLAAATTAHAVVVDLPYCQFTARVDGHPADWAAPSDARLKHAVEPLAGSLDRLLALRGVQFAYNEDAPKGYCTPGLHTGFIAQHPDWISRDAAGFLLVAPKGFEALTVEALRELPAASATIDSDQTRRLAALEADNQRLRQDLAEIRQALRDHRERPERGDVR